MTILPSSPDCWVGRLEFKFRRGYKATSAGTESPSEESGGAAEVNFLRLEHDFVRFGRRTDRGIPTNTRTQPVESILFKWASVVPFALPRRANISSSVRRCIFPTVAATNVAHDAAR